MTHSLLKQTGLVEAPMQYDLEMKNKSEKQTN